MDPATPYYYALSTIAQCAAALIGFFGLWRLERLQDRINTTNRSIDALDRDRTKLIASPLRADSRSHAYGEQLSRFDRQLMKARERYADLWTEQQRLIKVLVRFLLGTLALLAVAIVGLAFTEGLHTQVWPIRELVQRLERVIEHAGTRLRTWHGPTQIAGRLQSQWRPRHRRNPP